MKKILFIVPLYKDRSPSQRFRFEQYLSFFKKNQFNYTLSNLISQRNDKGFYSEGHILLKFFLLVKFIVIRIKDVLRASKYDIIFIQREAFFLGTTIFEYLLSKTKAKLIYDFDDAIWLDNVSPANKNLNWLKNTRKTEKIISYADLVLAGNSYLADYAKQFNKNIKIIPTTVDCDRFSNTNNINNNSICIGWSGSITTIKHFDLANTLLRKIKRKYGDRISFKVIGDKSYINKELDIQGTAWSSETEVQELSSIDIGIMPLPNDKWSKGKCGLKGLTYMSMGIPTVMSPVGVNTEIIQDGENGYLASNDDEWIEKLSLLIESRELREKIGREGRKTVLEKYSVASQKENYLKYIKELL